MWLIIAIVIVLAAIFYFTGIKSTRYWEERGVPSLKPWPYFGNLFKMLFRTRALAHILNDTYSAFPETRYCGFYNFSTPTLMIRDPELIKRITVKDFDVFPQHRPFLPDDVDPLWSKNLFAMRGGQKWQDTRSTLSPSFTSKKMRMMFELMRDCSKQFSNHFLKQGGMVEVELKDAFSRFANDVIATTALGVTCNSLENRNNEFYLMGKEVTTFTGLRSLLIMLSTISPVIAKMSRISMFSKKVKNFFHSVIGQTIQLREEKGIVRPDLIHLLMEARKDRFKSEDQNEEIIDTGFATVEESEIGKTQNRQKTELTDEDIVAQALIFFFAGFDTVSTMMCHVCYELALNSDIQKALREEVDDVLEKSKGNFTYENLLGMKYLDMVMAEALRKWPPFVTTDRQSVRSYVLEPERPDEKALYLPKSSVCTIPTYCIQRDPKYYPNPDKFDPERFSDENKSTINPFTYLPFGTGPRNCIGSRFALLEGKLVIAEIISKFEIIRTEKTQVPIQISKMNFNPIPDEGFWLGLKPRRH